MMHLRARLACARMQCCNINGQRTTYVYTANQQDKHTKCPPQKTQPFPACFCHESSPRPLELLSKLDGCLGSRHGSSAAVCICIGPRSCNCR